MKKYEQCVCGSKDTLVSAHGPEEGEVRSKVLDGIFVELFLVNILSIYANINSYFNHQKKSK